MEAQAYARRGGRGGDRKAGPPDVSTSSGWREGHLCSPGPMRKVGVQAQVETQIPVKVQVGTDEGTGVCR